MQQCNFPIKMKRIINLWNKSPGRFYQPTIPDKATDIRGFFKPIVFRFLFCHVCSQYVEEPWKELAKFRRNPAECDSIFCQACFQRACKTCISYRLNSELDGGGLGTKKAKNLWECPSCRYSPQYKRKTPNKLAPDGLQLGTWILKLIFYI